MTQEEQPSLAKPRIISFGMFAGFVAACALGPSLGTEAHSAFLLGAGNLPSDTVLSFPWVRLTLLSTNIHFNNLMYMFSVKCDVISFMAFSIDF